MTADRPYLPYEIGELFHVNPRTVSRWCAAGKFCDTTTGLDAFRTPGGQYRIPRPLVHRLLDGDIGPEPGPVP